jgi:hypothetical protein
VTRKPNEELFSVQHTRSTPHLITEGYRRFVYWGETFVLTSTHYTKNILYYNCIQNAKWTRRPQRRLALSTLAGRSVCQTTTSPNECSTFKVLGSKTLQLPNLIPSFWLPFQVFIRMLKQLAFLVQWLFALVFLARSSRGQSFGRRITRGDWSVSFSSPCLLDLPSQWQNDTREHSTTTRSHSNGATYKAEAPARCLWPVPHVSPVYNRETISEFVCGFVCVCAYVRPWVRICKG